MRITFEFFGELQRLTGAVSHQLTLDPAAPLTVGAALAGLQQRMPGLAAAVERSACACGDTLVRRCDPLPADGCIALLPPVAGG